MGNFDDLIPQKKGGNFDDLIPSSKKPNGFGDFANDAYTSLYNLTNNASFGLVDAARNADNAILKRNRPAPKAVTGPGKVASTVAGLYGAIEGGPGKISERIAEKVIPNMPKMGFWTKRTKDAISGASFGGLLPGSEEERKKAALTGAIVNPSVGAAQEKIVKPLAGRLMNSVLKPGYKQLTKGRNLGLDFANLDIFGTKKGMVEKASKLIDDNEARLQNILKNSKGEVDVLDIAANLDDLKSGYQNIGDDASIKAIEDLQNTLLSKSPSGKISAQDANALKRDFYNSLRESQFGTSEVPAKIAGKKKVAHDLKVGIEKAEPNQPIPEINRQMAVGGKSRDAIEKRLAQDQRNSLGGLIDMGLFGGGAFSGNPAAGTAAVLIRHGIGSTPVKSASAVALAKLAKNKAAGKIASFGVSKFGR